MERALDRLVAARNTLALLRLRALVRPRRYRALWAAVAVAFVIASLFIGQMLAVYPPGETDLSPQLFLFLDPSAVSNPYLVPSVIWMEPTFVLTLAFWPTLVMGLLGAGVGLAAAATVRLFVAERRRRADLVATGAVPAVTGVGLLGACCCLTCAQTAAVGAVAVAAGSSPAVFFVQDWPIGLFQLVVLGLSLLYLERQVGSPAPGRPAAQCPRRRSTTSAATALRLALLVGGMTWLLALILELSDASTPLPAGLYYHWAFEHVLLAGFAVVAGIAPEPLVRFFGRAAGSVRGVAIRAALAVAGVTWGVWVPPALVGIGLGGFLNELFGFLGLPATWGAETPDAPFGPGLYFHWIFQHEGIALFALAVAVSPRAVLLALGVDIPLLTPAPAGLSSAVVAPPVPVVAAESRP